MADFSLLGATMVNSSVVASARGNRDIVSEGYLLSDLAYARIRYELKLSEAFPEMMALCKKLLEHDRMRPDLYILLEAGKDTIARRQGGKGDRERNVTRFFRERYYSAIEEIHEELGEKNVEKVFTDSDPRVTLRLVLEKARRGG